MLEVAFRIHLTCAHTYTCNVLKNCTCACCCCCCCCCNAPQALEQLEGLPLNFPVPVGGCAILVGILLLVILDSTLAGILAPESYRNELQEDESNSVITEPNTRKGSLHHCHFGSSNAAPLTEGAAAMKTIRQGVTAVTMELGCIFHSVIIGISVGVMTGDKQLVLTMITALAIHQGLEGLALGSVLALTSFTTVKKVLMLFLYSITTPAGASGY
jgi:zinc transporter ZupT